jgi:transposase-like protein
VKHFTEQEKSDMINDYLSNKTITYIANKFKIDQSVLYRILKESKIKRIPNTYKEKRNEIIKLAKQNKTRTEISKLLKISTQSIIKVLREEGLNDYKVRKYTINETLLDDINTFQKAQFLGLMFADGCVIANTNQFCISLKEDDKEYLEDTRKYLEYSGPVALHKKATTKFFKRGNKFYKTKDAYGIRMCNTKFTNSLRKWGIEDNKSYVDFGISPIPVEHMNAFILGYFEGDGNIASSKIKNKNTISHAFSIICQPRFANELQIFFKNHLNINLLVYAATKDQPNLRRVYIYKFDDLVKLYHWMYDSAVYVMKRKHDKFLYIFNFFKNKGYEIGELRSF